MYYIYSFRSRNQSMRFYDSLKNQGIPSKIIPTPRSVSVGCGLSVQVSPEYYEAAARSFTYHSYDTFLGLFSLENGSVRRIGR